MRGDRLREAAERLIPFEQGRFDNLCGLYSILNAISLASWPTLELHSYRSRQLFNHGIRMLERKGLLRQVLKQGMREATWIWLCDKLLRKATRLGGIKLERLPILGRLGRADIEAAFTLIHRYTRLNRPVLICLLGSYNHYTVIVEKTDSQLKLFDSHGFRWVALRSCELHHRGAKARHQIARHSAAVIRRAG